jgi:hypothetical protein
LLLYSSYLPLRVPNWTVKNYQHRTASVHLSTAYIKGAHGEESTQLIHKPLPFQAALLHFLAAGLPWPPPSTFLTLAWPPEGLRRRRRITTATHRRATEFPHPCSAGSGILGVIVIAVRVRVRGGAARVVPKSLLQDLHDLEVGYVVFIINACAGA